MIKLYKKDDNGELYYAEFWVSSEDRTGTINTGIVGKRGDVNHFGMDDQSKSALDEFMTYYEILYKNDGYYELSDDDLSWVVVQFPMKSLIGNKRDRWLSNKVEEALNDELGWCGLGSVDGFDMGAKLLDRKKYILNIFCVVNDVDKSVAAIKRRLKSERLDYTKIKIGARSHSGEDGYSLVYSARKDNGEFSM